MNSTLEKPRIDKYTTDPYSARTLILQLEKKHNLTIRVYEGNKYCAICIDKEDKKEDV